MEHLKVGPGIDALKLHHSINTSTFAQGCVPAGHFSGEDRGVFPVFFEPAESVRAHAVKKIDQSGFGGTQ